mmetsp:Transcript_20093/g.62464  ORF Transcript_20093/g.62464 Transcript_20093/m.62464 type:complete len:315 (+) Transcript_20093:27-971(+)
MALGFFLPGSWLSAVDVIDALAGSIATWLTPRAHGPAACVVFTRPHIGPCGSPAPVPRLDAQAAAQPYTGGILRTAVRAPRGSCAVAARARDQRHGAFQTLRLREPAADAERVRGDRRLVRLQLAAECGRRLVRAGRGRHGDIGGDAKGNALLFDAELLERLRILRAERVAWRRAGASDDLPPKARAETDARKRVREAADGATGVGLKSDAACKRPCPCVADKRVALIDREARRVAHRRCGRRARRHRRRRLGRGARPDRKDAARLGELVHGLGVSLKARGRRLHRRDRLAPLHARARRRVGLRIRVGHTCQSV